PARCRFRCARAGSAARRMFRRFVFPGELDRERVLPYPEAAQDVQRLRIEVCRQFDRGILLVEVDLAEMAAFAAGFVCNGADDVLGRDLLLAADRDAVSHELALGNLAAATKDLLAVLARWALAARAVEVGDVRTACRFELQWP